MFSNSIWAVCALFRLTCIILISVLGEVWEPVPPPVRLPAVSPYAGLTAPAMTSEVTASGGPGFRPSTLVLFVELIAKIFLPRYQGVSLYFTTSHPYVCIIVCFFHYLSRFTVF